MSRYTLQDIDEIADAFRSGKGRGKPAHILFGAGCSKSAGVPLAREIVKDIHEKYPNFVGKLDPEDRHKYGACMRKLAPNERRDLIAGYLKNAKLNWAHIALAQLMCCGFIDRALTVNFDNILARACGLISLYPAIYDFATAPTANVSLIVSPAIVHLHGQGHGVVLLNTEEETKAHSEKIAPIMRQSLSDHPLLVIGYSGEADDVLRLVHQHYQNSEHLYWASFDEEPAGSIRELSKKHEYFDPIGGADADRFLIELAQQLDCWPPAFCSDPIGHLIEEIAPVLDYPTSKDSEINLLASTRARLGRLQEAEKTQRGVVDQLTADLLAGRLDQVVQVFRVQEQAGHADDAIREIAFVAVLTQGIQAGNKGQRASDAAEAERLLEAAEGKYEAALKIKPDQHDALNNWGAALAARAERASDPAEAERLFEAAEGKYEAALKIKPDQHEPLNNWGNALAARAKQASDPAEAERLFEAAEGKYEAALKIKPDQHEPLNNWGNALAARAKQASDPAEAKRLFEAAEGKYEAALKIKPDKHESLVNWGLALADRAERASDPAEVDRLFVAAAEKCEAALKIKPDKHEALNNWGATLAARAKQASDPAEAERLFEAAEGKYEAALKIKPDQHEPLVNWGNALAARAERASDPAEAERLFEAVEGKYGAALKIKSDQHEALNNWGATLAARAERASDPAEAERLFEAAEGKYGAALKIKSDQHEALNNWGNALAARAKRASDPAEADQLLRLAEEKCLEALKLSPGETYNLACVMALRNRTDECRELLETAEKANTLPSADHLKSDEDLASVRGEPWFAALVERRRNKP